MPSRKTPPLPSPAAREALLEVIRAAPGPLTVAAIAKALVAPCRIRANDMPPILDEFVAAGRLFVVPPKTAKGRPLYWHQDVGALTRAAAFDAIRRSDAPLTASQIARQLTGPLKAARRELEQILAELASKHTLHKFAPATAKGGPRYWDRDHAAFGRLALLKALDAHGPQTATKLKKAARGLSDEHFEQVLQRLMAEGAVYRHPPIGKSKTELLGSRPPAPAAYLHDVATQLQKVVEQLRAARVPRDELRRALVELVASAGVPLDGAASLRGATQPDKEPAKVDLLALMKRLDAGAERGALVGAGALRRAANLDKVQFDGLVLELARQGRLSLHRHDFAASLSAFEREELVTDGQGTYFVGMAIRQSRE
ncbi:MAG: hypothetical protein ACT4QC_03750 [Planctomycetaceae bacterium]